MELRVIISYKYSATGMPPTIGLWIIYLAVKCTCIWSFVPDDTKYHMIEEGYSFVVNLAV